MTSCLPGQEFWIGLEFPRPGFESVRVTVKLRRGATTDRTESADPRWPWSVKSAHGEAEHKVRMAAMASGVFNPSARLGGARVQTTVLTNFFTPPKPPGAPDTAVLGKAPPGTAPPGTHGAAAAARAGHHYAAGRARGRRGGDTNFCGPPDYS